MIRTYLLGLFTNIVVVAWLAWRVLRGGMTGDTAIIACSLTLVILDGLLMVRLWLERSKPKPTLTGQFPWRAWRRGNALFAGVLVWFALKGYGAADLAFAAILLFGVGNVATVVIWLWDRHTLHHRAQSEQ